MNLVRPGAHWFACRTRSRAEKKAIELLQREGIQSYLPLIERERQWADRKTRVEFPLFPGYVFARFPVQQMRTVLGVPGVAGVLGTDGVPTPVRDEELASVRVMVDAARRTGIAPLPIDFLHAGQAVKVTGGPFAGMHGILLERRGRTRVAVQLTAIRLAVSVEMDRRHLVPLLDDDVRHRGKSG